MRIGRGAIPTNNNLPPHADFQCFGVHVGIDGLRGFHSDGAGGKARFGGGFQVTAFQVSPDQSGHEGVAATGGIDQSAGDIGQPQLLIAHGGEDALCAQTDEQPVDAQGKELVRSLDHVLLAVDFHAGQQLCFQLVGLQRVDLMEDGPELFCLDGGNRVDEQGDLQVFCQKCQGFGGDVGISHHHLGVLQQRQVCRYPQASGHPQASQQR